MFTNLIESNSRKKELERKGSFFLGTLVAYCLLLAVAGLASIYAYDARLDDQNMEAATLVTPILSESILQATTTRHINLPTATAKPNNPTQLPPKTEAIASVAMPDKAPKTIGLTADNLPTALPNAIGNRNLSDPIIGFTDAPSFANYASGDDSRNTRRSTEIIERDIPPETPRQATPKAASKPPSLVSLGVINGIALQKPVPAYPAAAKLTGVSGMVVVQVLLNEEGEVISAHAVSGHPLLRDAAVRAAYQARFSPTLLSKQPVKVSGAITYNFRLD